MAMEASAEEDGLSWLSDFIRADFYVPCQCSPKASTNFCCECKGLPFCDDCRNHTYRHQDHNVLRVCKVSRQIGTAVLMIKRYLDVADIQTYSCNAQKVVYKSKRQKNDKDKLNSKVVGNRCEICGWSNLSSSIKFCSIECKVDWMSKVRSLSCSIRKTQSSEEPLQGCRVAQPHSFRKRPRKGIPSRSPLM